MSYKTVVPPKSSSRCIIYMCIIYDMYHIELSYVVRTTNTAYTGGAEFMIELVTPK